MSCRAWYEIQLVSLLAVVVRNGYNGPLAKELPPTSPVNFNTVYGLTER